jgi:protein-disulfide isomerase
MRMVFRHFPLSQHANAIPAAEASEAASNQGKFWQMFDLLYANQTDWAEKTTADADTIFDGFATTLGLNMTTFKADEVASTTLAAITAEQDEGTSIGIDHTPTFFVNGKEVSPTTYEDFKAIIDAAATSTAQ